MDLHRGAPLSRLPILILNVHSDCNCRCVMCDIWQRKDRLELAAISLERHRKSFIELGVRQVVLSGGEPLLNRDFTALCDFFHGLDIRITLLTTGLLLHSKAAVVAKGIDEIIISIDGPPVVHDQIRRIPRAFETIARGVEAVRLLRPRMDISCRTTVQKQNHAHLRETVEAAHDLRLDRISFLPADLSSSAFNREISWARDRKDEIALDPTELLVLRAEIESLIASHQADITSGFIAEGEAKLRNLATRFREHLEEVQPVAPSCNAPWVSAVMELDGSVRPCFFHPSVGSTVNDSFAEALNSATALDFRSRLKVSADPICQRCVCSLNYRDTAVTP